MGQVNIADSGNSAIQSVAKFIDRINSHDVAALNELMAPHFRFVDATGANYPSPEMRKGWARYFTLFPDYRIDAEEMFADGNRVAVFGWASGSFQGERYSEHGRDWRIPAAWKAVTKGDQIVEWRIYADIEAMMLSCGIQRFPALPRS